MWLNTFKIKVLNGLDNTKFRKSWICATLLNKYVTNLIQPTGYLYYCLHIQKKTLEQYIWEWRNQNEIQYFIINTNYIIPPYFTISVFIFKCL